MTAALTLASRVRVSDDVVFRDLQGEAALLHLGSGVFFGLDPVGSRIWHLIRGHRTLRRVLDALLDEYEAAEEACGRDLLRFVAALRSHDLVRIDPPPSG